VRDFDGKIGVISVAGTGMGRELSRQLAAEGCHLALCDIAAQNLETTISLCREENPGAKVTGAECDVSEHGQIERFCEHVREAHGTDHINLLINNAGISGGGSFVETSREEWERTFDICWSGVYLMTRAFMPMLLKSSEGHIVNMSSANALRAVLGGHIPHTAYSSAKFAVKGFSEALIHDFRFNAPHLKVSVVMPGHVGTEIMVNSAEILGQRQPGDWTDEDVLEARRRWEISGLIDHSGMDDDQVRAAGAKEIEDMRALGLSSSEAAGIILEGVRNDSWRILVGADTVSLDALVRESPDTAYDPDFVLRWREAYKRLVDGDQPQ
jgi:NAD(P)-dependent dehydrogenase (short-subunit alcohol dehydrogenase family)